MKPTTSAVIARGKHLALVRKNGWEYVKRVCPGGVVVLVPLTTKGRIVLVEQYRVPVRSRVIELPAGLADKRVKNGRESLSRAANRELFEETGYRARRLVKIAQGPVSAGLASEIVTFFLATGLRKAGPGGGDPGESIKVHEVPLGNAVRWLAQRRRLGIAVDPKVYAGLFFLNTLE